MSWSWIRWSWGEAGQRASLCGHWALCRALTPQVVVDEIAWSAAGNTPGCGAFAPYRVFMSQWAPTDMWPRRGGEAGETASSRPGGALQGEKVDPFSGPLNRSNSHLSASPKPETAVFPEGHNPHEDALHKGARWTIPVRGQVVQESCCGVAPAHQGGLFLSGPECPTSFL